jgi:hypothetical protein
VAGVLRLLPGAQRGHGLPAGARTALDRGGVAVPRGARAPARIERVRDGLDTADADHPFLLYGTDWLAFAHLVIAVAFLGPYRDPVRNIWVVEFGLIACAGVIPLALVCGPIRGIPFWWSVVDMAFGVFGAVPLYVVRARTKRLEALTEAAVPGGVAAPAQ